MTLNGSGYVQRSHSSLAHDGASTDHASHIQAFVMYAPEELHLSVFTLPIAKPFMQIVYIAMRSCCSRGRGIEFELAIDVLACVQDPQALEKLGAFVTAMEDLDKRIVARGNNTANKIGGNVGSRFLPYEILRPHSSQGMTGRGVPYSTSI